MLHESKIIISHWFFGILLKLIEKQQYIVFSFNYGERLNKTLSKIFWAIVLEGFSMWKQAKALPYNFILNDFIKTRY